MITEPEPYTLTREEQLALWEATKGEFDVQSKPYPSWPAFPSVSKPNNNGSATTRTIHSTRNVSNGWRTPPKPAPSSVLRGNGAVAMYDWARSAPAPPSSRTTPSPTLSTSPPVDGASKPAPPRRPISSLVKGLSAFDGWNNDLSSSGWTESSRSSTPTTARSSSSPAPDRTQRTAPNPWTSTATSSPTPSPRTPLTPTPPRPSSALPGPWTSARSPRTLEEPKCTKATSLERKAALEKLKLLVYSRTPVPAPYNWQYLLKDTLVFQELGVPLNFILPVDEEMYNLLQFEPSREKLPKLADLVEAKIPHEIDNFRVDLHALAAANFIWNSNRTTTRQVAALALTAEHIMLYELLDNFAQVSRIRSQLEKHLPLLKAKVQAQDADIERKLLAGHLQAWDDPVLRHEKGKALVKRFENGQSVLVIGKLPTLTDRALGVPSFPMLSTS